MIHVQHLLGVGHWQRTAMLARALAAANFNVLLVSGGRPQPLALTPRLKLAQLAPLISADSSFSRLHDDQNQPIDDNWRDARRTHLLNLYAAFAPQVLITETFPFGRRMLRFELLPLLQTAHADAGCRLIVASIRDVLQSKTKPGRNREICELIDRYYDHVLVHADPGLLRLQDSFSESDNLTVKIEYSGYIASSPVPAQGANGEVLVSAGGSATGLQILHRAIAAKPLSSLAALRWRIRVSPAIAAPEYAELKRRAGDDIRVERNRPDFAGLLQGARLSISQAGYNTVTDILRSGTKAVLIPFADAGEVEQTIRADRLAQKLGMVRLAASKLSPATLAAAVDAADRTEVQYSVDLDGAARSAELIRGWLAAARA